MEVNTQLGMNNNHIEIEEIETFGFNRIEVGLGYSGSYEKRLSKALHDIEYAEDHCIPYSIHLPIYCEDASDQHFLDAFYLDVDPVKREKSFSSLKDNLNRFSQTKVEYFVIHFHGVYLDEHMPKVEFDILLEGALKRIDELAGSVGKKILLEYFGSTKLFADYREWTRRIAQYEHLGLLMDTGHLYYASILHDFDFDTAFSHLVNHSEAFHLWTTRGHEAYAESRYYREYRHISARLDQVRADGWAFDTWPILDRLIASNKPIVLEASPLYKGTDYFYESARELIKYVNSKK